MQFPQLPQLAFSQQLQRPFDGVPLWEWAGVGLVGVALGVAARTFGVQGVMGGALLYVLGYFVRGRRPAEGWRYLPSPVFAVLPGMGPEPVVLQQPVSRDQVV
jgi:uncharacterized membrane protein